MKVIAVMTTLLLVLVAIVTIAVHVCDGGRCNTPTSVSDLPLGCDGSCT
jgi:hypothetical protein